MMVKAAISSKELISYVESYMACLSDKSFTVNETTVNTSYLIMQWIPRMKCFQELCTLLIFSVYRHTLLM